MGAQSRLNISTTTTPLRPESSLVGRTHTLSVKTFLVFKPSILISCVFSTILQYGTLDDLYEPFLFFMDVCPTSTSWNFSFSSYDIRLPAYGIKAHATSVDLILLNGFAGDDSVLSTRALLTVLTTGISSLETARMMMDGRVCPATQPCNALHPHSALCVDSSTPTPLKFSAVAARPRRTNGHNEIDSNYNKNCHYAA